MNKQTSRILLLLAAAMAVPSARADDIHVVVRPEIQGTEMVYRYELFNHSSTFRMMRFTIGVTPNDPAEPDGPSLGTLTRLPTDTLWVRAPARSLEYPDLPHPSACCLIPASSPTGVGAPPGWRPEIGGQRVPNKTYTPEEIAYERYAITWYAPYPVYGGPLNITGADAGQRLTGFNVRVPQDSATGPGSLGSLANYTQGEFEADLWFGPSVIEDTEVKRRGRIVVSPSLEVSFTTVPELDQSRFPAPVLPNTLITVTANIVPLLYGGDGGAIPVIRLESIDCWGDCWRTQGVTGAAFGTDDREFQLQAASHRLSDRGLWRYRIYDIIYSVTDSAGTRNTVKSTITIASRRAGY